MTVARIKRDDEPVSGRDKDPAIRNKYIDYLANWDVPYDRVYATGMPVYSPWFHTTDVRFLWLIHGLRKHDKSIYLACIGWIILDAAIVIGVIVRQ